MKRTKLVSLLLAAVMLVSLMTACGSQPQATPSAPAPSQSSGEPAPGGSDGEQAPEKTFRLSWAPAYDEEHGLTQAGLWADEKLRELSGGKMAFEFFPGGQLGNEREVFESVHWGQSTLPLCPAL